MRRRRRAGDCSAAPSGAARGHRAAGCGRAGRSRGGSRRQTQCLPWRSATPGHPGAGFRRHVAGGAAPRPKLLPSSPRCGGGPSEHRSGRLLYCRPGAKFIAARASKCEPSHISLVGHGLNTCRQPSGGWLRAIRLPPHSSRRGRPKPMRTAVAQADHAAPFPIFAMPSGEELAATTFTPDRGSFGPVRHHDSVSVATDAHAHFDRDTIINRLLDWAAEAREQGRLRRYDYLVCLAWEAYDRVPCQLPGLTSVPVPSVIAWTVAVP